MFLNENQRETELPLYRVEELSMEEALLVLTAEKELLECRQAVFASHSRKNNWDRAVPTSSQNGSH